MYFIAVSRSHSGFKMPRRYSCTAVVTVTWLSRDLSFINKQSRRARTSSLYQQNTQAVNVRTRKGIVISLRKLALSMFQFDFWPAPTSCEVIYEISNFLKRKNGFLRWRFWWFVTRPANNAGFSLETSTLTVSLTYFLDLSYPRSHLIPFWFICRLDLPFTGLQFLP